MKILIIDDEISIAKMVQEQLDMEKHAIECADIATSAEMARQLMTQTTYDIFLCDIVMPKEDGIQFAKWVLSNYEDVKFVFLTSHADFNYMKQAISLQSFDYLLQPVSDYELDKVVERAIRQLTIERKNRQIMEKGNFYSNHEEALLEEGVRAYFSHQNEEELWLEKLVNVHDPDYSADTVILPVLVQVVRTEKDFHRFDRELLRSVYYNITNELFQSMPWKVSLFLKETEGDFYCFLCMKEEEQPETPQLTEILETMHAFFERLLDTSIAIYPGTAGKLSQMREQVTNLEERAKNNIRKEDGIQMSGGIDTNEKQAYSFEAQLGSWGKLLDKKMYREFLDSVQEYIDRYSRRNRTDLNYMALFHQAVTGLLLSHMISNNIESGRIFDEQLPYLAYMTSYEDLDSFKGALIKIVEKIRSEMAGTDFDVIEQAIKYLHENMDKDISVAEISEYVGMNPEYFTKIFKKRTGLGLKKYMTQEKMKAAKMLLETTELSVTMIADHVGYSNYSNFTYVFRQSEGCTPMDYRKKVKGQKL